MISKQGILKKLQELPALISFAEEKAQTARYQYDLKETEYDHIYNEALLTCKVEKQTDKVSKAEAEKASYGKKMECLIAKSKYKKAEIEFNKYDREFTAIRKIANLMQIEWDAIHYGHKSEKKHG